jgi:hypothetical protein
LATARATRPNETKPSVWPAEPRNLQERRPSLAPASLAHHLVLLDDAAEARQQQRHGVIGDFLDEGVGHVGDGNAARGRRLDVDAVDADAAERDDLAVFQGIDDGLGDRHALGVDGVGVAVAAAMNSASSAGASTISAPIGSSASFSKP